MTNIIGRLHQIGIGKESSRGTAVAATYWLKALSVKLDTKVKQITDDQSFGRIETSDGATNVESYGELEITTKLHEQSTGLLLLATLGTVASVAKGSPNTAVYDHTFTVSNTNTHAALTIAHKSSNDDVRYPLAMLDSLKIESKPGGYPTLTASFISKASASATNSPSFLTEKDFLPKHLTFKKASAQSGLDGASAVKIRSFNMEIKKNLMPVYVLGSNAPDEIINQNLEVSGSVTLVSTDGTWSTLQSAETDQALRFDFIHTDTIGTSSNPEVKIDLYKARISGYTRNINMNGLVEETFDFTALYSPTDSAMIAAVLTNLVTSY